MIMISQDSLIIIVILHCIIIAHTGCMGSTSSTIVTVIEPIAASNGISGELSCEYHAPTIMVTLIMMRLCFKLSW